MLRLFYANYFVFALAADLFTTLDARMERNAEKDVSGDNNNNNNKAEAKAEALKKIIIKISCLVSTNAERKLLEKYRFNLCV